jgi:hypothetical protein
MQIVLYSATDTFFVDSKDLNHVNQLYAFFILVFSRSVIAAPYPPAPEKIRQHYGESMFLEGNEDFRLKSRSKWGRLIPPPAERHRNSWSHVWPCDDFLEIETFPQVVMSVFRPERELDNEGRGKYSVVRNPDYSVKLTKVYGSVPRKYCQWAKFLDGTYWVREPNIVGGVSDGVMIWKPS